jgi:hypothetical protein
MKRSSINVHGTTHTLPKQQINASPTRMWQPSSPNPKLQKASAKKAVVVKKSEELAMLDAPTTSLASYISLFDRVAIAHGVKIPRPTSRTGTAPTVRIKESRAKAEEKATKVRSDASAVARVKRKMSISPPKERNAHGKL